MKIIAIANQKGGVGKTTTAVNLSASLAELGHSTLLIDLDPQANASSSLGNTPVAGQSIYQPLLGQSSLDEKIAATPYANLSMIPGEIDLAGCEIEIARNENHLTRLRTLLHEYRSRAAFEFAILDCPPSLGILMTNALAAADTILVPLQCEYFALEGLSKILSVIDQIRTGGYNPSLAIEGILLTMYDARTNLSQQVAEDVRSHLKEKVFTTLIPRTVRLSEAPSHGKPILAYDNSGIGSQSYRELAKEFILRQTVATA
jgi:chromosome partitioning protein